MDYTPIIADIKNKVFSPIYFLEGEEPYFLDLISDYILENVLSEDEKGFNQSILYGKDLSIDTIMTTAKRFPMMAERQVVVIREAQNIRNIEDLSAYAEKPMKSTILVINHKYKTIDKRKKLYKAVQKNGVYFESKPLYDNQIPAWISKYLKGKNLGIDPRAAQMIADFIGSDLQRIVNELEKVYKELLGIYNDRRVSVVTHPGYANIILKQEMFEIPTIEVPKIQMSFNGQNYKGQETTQNVLYKKFGLYANFHKGQNRFYLKSNIYGKICFRKPI